MGMSRGSGRRRGRLGLASIALLAIACAIPLEPARAGPPFLVSSTISLGGQVTDLVVDAQGNSVVAGIIGSYNFPGVDSAAITNAGMGLRFVARINTFARTPAFVAVVGAPAGSQQGAAGDFGKDEAAGLALDAAGNAYLVAYDGSKDYPVVGGLYQWSTGKKYVFKVSSSGQVSKYSIALDPAIQRVGAIAIDANGAIYLTGSAQDGLQTTPGAPYPTGSVAAGCIAPYVMKLDRSGQTVVYATYLGNSGTQNQICGGTVYQGQFLDPKNIYPTGFAIALDSAGNAYVTGQAEPGLAATPGAVDFGTKVRGLYPYNGMSVDAASHAFISKINPTGTGIVYTARIGGSLRDRGTSILVDGTGAVVIAGETSSRDFPIIGGGPEAYFPFVGMECLLWTPEVGFLTKLSADGMQILFSNFLSLNGAQLDDCQGYGTFTPAKVILDEAGNIVVAGYTAAYNRDIDHTFGAIIPAPTGNQSDIGDQLLQILSADGRRLLYSTTLYGGPVRGLALDPWQSLLIAGGNIQRLSPGTMPVEISVGPYPACAGQAVSLSAHVAGSNGAGTVDFQVDAVSVGTAAITGSVASKSAMLTVGIRQIKATYHGAGSFDGYSSEIFYVPVNQAGACQ